MSKKTKKEFPKIFRFITEQKYFKKIKKHQWRLITDSFLILNSLFLILLRLLHPFMPFVTEEIYQRFKFGESIMIDSWPKHE